MSKLINRIKAKIYEWNNRKLRMFAGYAHENPDDLGQLVDRWWLIKRLLKQGEDPFEYGMTYIDRNYELVMLSPEQCRGDYNVAEEFRCL